MQKLLGDNAVFAIFKFPTLLTPGAFQGRQVNSQAVEQAATPARTVIPRVLTCLAINRL